MPGSPIPDDWDGETYECQSIMWPSSPLWRAILFGQVSEPSDVNYWQQPNGDAETASRAVSIAYGLTIGQENHCGVNPQMLEQLLPPSYLLVGVSANQTILATQNQRVDFDTLVENNGTHGFNFSLHAHGPLSVDKPGLWQYFLQISFDLADVEMRIYSGGVDNGWDITWEGPKVFTHSWIFNNVSAQDTQKIRIVPTSDIVVQGGVAKSFWSMHYLGEI